MTMDDYQALDNNQPETTTQTDELQQTPRQIAAAALADVLYDRTAHSKVTSAKWLKQNAPKEVDRAVMDELLAAVDAGKGEDDLSHIAMTRGGKDKYYYNASIMTQEYARLDAMLEDKDILKTIATVTRSDCKLYPRPTEFSKLMGYPFRFSLDEVEGAAARMQLREEYGDIGVVQASNGAKAFYSSQFVKEGYARALLEGSEVEAHEWP